MPKVLPSHVVATIDKAFPQAQQESRGGPQITLQLTDATRLRAIADLADAVPSELITVSEDRYAAFRMALGSIRGSLDLWLSLGGGTMLQGTPGVGDKSPVTVIREVLADSRDTPLAQRSGALSFIRNKKLRAALLADIAEAEGAFAAGQWKATTVLAGSVVEALLLWRLQKLKPAALASAISGAVSAKAIPKPPQGKPEDWRLVDLIAIAGVAGIVKPNTVNQCGQARDFRNLIHPGVVQKVGARADRGTALAALAAVEFVVRDVSGP